MVRQLSSRPADRVRLVGHGLLLVIAITLLNGCANDSLRKEGGRLFVSWQEQVQLSDGQVIVAERSDEYENVGDSGSGYGRGGWLYRRGSIRATLPAPISRTVAWEGTLQPLVLDLVSGNEVYFLGRVAAARDIRAWNIPRNQVHRDPSVLYVVFRLTPQGWQRIPLSEIPSIEKPNLLAHTRQFFEKEKVLIPGSLVGLNIKRKLNSDPRLVKPLRVIVRPSAK